MNNRLKMHTDRPVPPGCDATQMCWFIFLSPRVSESVFSVIWFTVMQHDPLGACDVPPEGELLARGDHGIVATVTVTEPAAPSVG